MGGGSGDYVRATATGTVREHWYEIVCRCGHKAGVHKLRRTSLYGSQGTECRVKRCECGQFCELVRENAK